MTKNLFFLRLIADALQQPDTKAAIKDAFEKIEKLGQKPEYRRGFKQFNQFMSVMNTGLETPSDSFTRGGKHFLRDIAFQLATGLFEGNKQQTQTLLQLINSDPGLKDEFETFIEGSSKMIMPEINLEIIIERNGETIISIPIKSGKFSEKIKNIYPGQYEIRLNTGRVLWEGELTHRDLLWTEAFPDADLALAADTSDTPAEPTKEIKLLNGEFSIRVFPGIEAGLLEIERVLV